jgi:hypothetical protein
MLLPFKYMCGAVGSISGKVRKSSVLFILNRGALESFFRDFTLAPLKRD